MGLCFSSNATYIDSGYNFQKKINENERRARAVYKNTHRGRGDFSRRDMKLARQAARKAKNSAYATQLYKQAKLKPR